METLTPDTPSGITICENCRNHQSIEKKFCSSCSFPVQGTDEEKYNFRLRLSSRKRLLKDAEGRMKSARTMIYVAAGLFLVSGLIAFFTSDDYATLLVSLIICVVYLILAVWSSKNSFAAILTAMIIYLTIQLINVIAAPESLFSGIILKIIIIVAFAKGIKAALEAKNLLGQLDKLGASDAIRRT